MKRPIFLLKVILTALFSLPAISVLAAPANFIFAGSADRETLERMLARSDVEGIQIIYDWKRLEPKHGVYDFSGIERDLDAVSGLGKKLFVQLQDRFFSLKARNIPDYLLTGPEFGGGLAAQVEDAEKAGSPAYGWVAMQWNEPLRHRYQALLSALAKKFDGRIFGINLPETSVDVSLKEDKTGFDCDAYFNAEMENARFARSVFKQSQVVQYINFWPCEWENDHNYMSRFFDFAVENGIGLGGPDIVPYRRGQMKNSYPFFNRDKDKLSLVAMAIQEPTLAYINENTGKPFTRQEFLDFATGYLGADIIFWSDQADWLSEQTR